MEHLYPEEDVDVIILDFHNCFLKRDFFDLLVFSIYFHFFLKYRYKIRMHRINVKLPELIIRSYAVNLSFEQYFTIVLYD